MLILVKNMVSIKNAGFLEETGFLIIIYTSLSTF